MKKAAFRILLGIAIFFGGVFAGPYLGDILPHHSSSSSTTAPVVVSFDDIAELATEQVTGRYIYEYTQEKEKVLGIEIPFTGKSALIEYDGTAKAGIKDATQIKVADVDEDAKTVTVDAPSVELLDVYTANSKIWDVNDSIFNSFRFEDYPGIEDAIKDEFESYVEGTDLLERAEKSAEAFIVDRVRSVYGSDYTVSVNWA
ncbi:MAG: DUF4230 domain-containing protein [Lactimicrobium sp.]|uniref:DUF4230 domain-containing protein n=1 Tax=Lactimicrobium sp. TaxID=2563780 RepID=UPI002F3526D7